MINPLTQPPTSKLHESHKGRSRTISALPAPNVRNTHIPNATERYIGINKLLANHHLSQAGKCATCRKTKACTYPTRGPSRTIIQKANASIGPTALSLAKATSSVVFRISSQTRKSANNRAAVAAIVVASTQSRQKRRMGMSWDGVVFMRMSHFSQCANPDLLPIEKPPFYEFGGPRCSPSRWVGFWNGFCYFWAERSGSLLPFYSLRNPTQKGDFFFLPKPVPPGPPPLFPVSSQRGLSSPTPPIRPSRSHHRNPLLSTNTMPVRVARFGIRGRPPFGLGGSGGKSGSITSHNLSGINSFAIPNFTKFVRFC